MEKLGINGIMIIAQIINFAIIVFFLKKYLYKPIIKALDDRKKKAQETEDLNTEAKESVKKAEDQSKDIKDKAEKDADKIISAAKIQAEKEREEILAKGHKEVEEMRKNLEKDIKQERDELASKLKKETAELVMMVSEKVIRQSVDDKKHKELISEAIKELEKVTVH